MTPPKAPHCGEDPAHPQGPAEGQQHIGLRPAGDTEITGNRLHVDGLRRRFKLPGDGSGKRARVRRCGKPCAKPDTQYAQGDPQNDFFHGASLSNLIIIIFNMHKKYFPQVQFFISRHPSQDSRGGAATSACPPCFPYIFPPQPKYPRPVPGTTRDPTGKIAEGRSGRWGIGQASAARRRAI